jgi:hypothetical protein
MRVAALQAAAVEVEHCPGAALRLPWAFEYASFRRGTVSIQAFIEVNNLRAEQD